MRFLWEREVILTFSIVVFPMLYISIVLLFFVDLNLFVVVSLEDRLAESLTAFFLFLTAIIALLTVISIKRRRGYFHWFFVVVGALFLLGFLEEINFGQSILKIEVPEFFLKNSSAPVLNLHNLFQGFAGQIFNEVQADYFQTKTIAKLAAIAYGVYLPILAFTGIGRKFFHKIKLVVPPLELVPGFVLAAVLLSDTPTGKEEEYGELLLSLCFLLQMWLERLTHTENP